MNGLIYIGKFEYRSLLKDIDRKPGLVANTDNAFYICDGDKWVLEKYNSPIRMKVLDRGYVLGRGYYTVIDNYESIPITLESTIRKKLDSLKIKGIENLNGETGVLPNWSLITSSKTIGDYITIDLDGYRPIDNLL